MSATDEATAYEEQVPQPPPPPTPPALVAGESTLGTEEGPAAEATSKPTRLPSLWKNRDYMLLWSGQTISALGSSMSGIVFPLLILSLTDSPAAAGIAAALAQLPFPVLSLPVGALIDRWDRKKVMILCDIGRALSLASVPVALSLGVLTVWQLYLNALIEGTLFVFFNIAEVACLPRVVSKAQLPAATAQNEATWGTASLIGPPVGGFLFDSLGRMFPFIFDAVSYSASVISLFFIKTKFQGEHSAERRKLTVEIREGLSWLWNQKLVRFMAVLTGGLNLVNSASYLIIIVIARNMGADSFTIGFMISIAAIGGIAGAIVGGQIQKRFSFGQVIITTVWIVALIFPLYAVAPNIYLIAGISAIIWMTTPIYNVVQFSYRMALIPDRLQGRVNSAVRLIAWGTQPVGAFLAGVLLEQYGPVPAVLTFAAWLVAMAVLATLNSHVRNARPIEQISET
jgi:predicted MFS family arabinose efflux permease